jgi:hypothetical protein
MSMFTKLTDTNIVPIFLELVLLMALVAVLTRFLDLTPDLGMWILWSCTPTVAVLILVADRARVARHALEKGRSWV